MNVKLFTTAAAGGALLALAACGGSGSSTPGATVTVTTPASQPAAAVSAASPASTWSNNSPNPLGQTDAQICGNLAQDWSASPPSLITMNVDLQMAVSQASAPLVAGATALMADEPPSGIASDPWASNPANDAQAVSAACQSAGVQLPAFPDSSNWTS